MRPWTFPGVSLPASGAFLWSLREGFPIVPSRVPWARWGFGFERSDPRVRGVFVGSQERIPLHPPPGIR